MHVPHTLWGCGREMTIAEQRVRYQSDISTFSLWSSYSQLPCSNLFVWFNSLFSLLFLLILMEPILRVLSVVLSSRDIWVKERSFYLIHRYNLPVCQSHVWNFSLLHKYCWFIHIDPSHLSISISYQSNSYVAIWYFWWCAQKNIYGVVNSMLGTSYYQILKGCRWLLLIHR